ncbi:hypothetical protein JKF63_06574 [Porcisia hertigi]|uniref:PPIase cyclophilin-type domain-containing protein n=1 Tax=Porcisia hertigi TaxID=2761500 RepID=A0A836IXL7_9TRYP|nr:hypothetical protein JKF63_06574 [Porcisia hertigi]
MTSYGSSDEENEDFSPILPSAAVAASVANGAADVATSTRAPSDTDATSPALKRERKDASEAHCTTTASSASVPPATLSTSLEAPPPPPPVATLSQISSSAAVEDASATGTQSSLEVIWERYRRQQLPSAPLYERSFLHTSLQDAHDALATASADTSPLMAVQTVHDMCVHLDSLGALIATIDAAGVVRVWRKLPRSLFFITELDKVFPPIPSSGGGAAGGHERRTRHHYWAHAYTALQMLVFVRVEEEWEMDLDDGHVRRTELDDVNSVPSTPAGKTPLGTVRVHMRQVNPITLTVEERDSFAFQAPVQRVVSAAAVAVEAAPHRHDGARQRAHNGCAIPDDACWTTPVSLAYTRQPVFLTHQYAPHIAFFVTLPPSSATSGSTGGGSGVVLRPCFASATSTDCRSDQAAGGARYCAPTRLSVANAVVACAQQGLGLERTGSSACVLVDAAGIVDYCTIEPAADAPTRATDFTSTRSGGLTLKVMAGLAAVPPTSREARVWRQWIRFDRRQHTGFFSLIRDSQQAIKTPRGDENARPAGEAAVADVQVLPATVQLTPDGQHVLVWSFRFVRVAAKSMQPASRIPSTERRYDVTLESCLHLLDFMTGICIGRYTEPVGVFTTSEDLNFRDREWASYMRLRSSALALHLHVEPSAAAKNQFYVMLPELPLEQLLGVGMVSRGTAAAAAATTQVAGRVVYVYEVTLEASASSLTTQQTSATVRRFPHQPGEWEAVVRRGADRPWQGSHHGGSDASKAQCCGSLATPQAALWGVLHLRSPNEYAPTLQEENRTRNETQVRGGEAAVMPTGLAVCRAPLLLLRRAVTASQDLKNLVAASPVGAALGADARKHLFLAPRSNGTPCGPASGETLLLSTSADVSSAALLVYSSELPWGSAALGRMLSEGAPQPTEEEGRGLQERAKQESWVKALHNLHHGRDDACGTLLLATVAPQSSSTAATPGGVGEAATTNSMVTADMAGGGSSSVGGVQAETTTTESTATTSVRVTAAKRAIPVTDEESVVRTLLKDLLPPVDASSTPVALVHVRGYGSIRVHLFPTIAPLATENFVCLAQRHYFDRLTFHRIIPAAIVQGGCPRGDGTGGESAFAGGAPFRDEGLTLFPFFSHTTNPLCCWLCMANAGPNTNGSQFFFTVPGGEAMPWLNGHHTVFGYACEGLDVVRAMSMAARDEEDKPLSPIVIERVDVLSA